ncbi:MAG: hypothetical protein C5S49_01725 [Candidatus Methanogaster sp.]|nr:MAG: hypothetical protein C5S49_01725 [ANME-2 cluster archaeon]
MSLIIHRIIIIIYIIDSTHIIVLQVWMVVIYPGVEDCNLNSTASVISMNDRSTDMINTPWKLLCSRIKYIITFNIFHIGILLKSIDGFRWYTR